VRLFVGIELSGDALEEILRVRSQLIGPLTRQGVRFVRPEKLHLTLAFLGSVEEGNVAPLTTALGEIQSHPIGLKLSPIGCFPNAQRPKVIWIGIGGDIDALSAVADAVSTASRPFAPDLEETPFSPHITLARISPGSKEVGRLLEREHIVVQPVEFGVAELCLFHSVPDGTYQVLGRSRMTAST
jgi:2'-5' RNA ligase